MMEDNQNKSTDRPVSAIRTFQSDVENIVKSGEGSMARIAIAENERRIKQGGSFENTQEEPTGSLRNKIILIASIVLILAGAVIITVIFLNKPKEEQKVPIASNQFAIINPDNIKSFDITNADKKQIISIIANERDNAKSKSNSVTSINLNEKGAEIPTKIKIGALFKKLELTIPDSVTRNLSGDYVLGFHNFVDNKMFLVVRTEYYQNTLLGMLAWEKNMREDLSNIFIPVKSVTSATSSDQLIKQPDIFSDVIIKNKDARILKDAEGKIVLMYSFPDKNTLVITTSPDTLNQIVSRLIKIKQIQ